jgi:hypothetical protein
MVWLDACKSPRTRSSLAVPKVLGFDEKRREVHMAGSDDGVPEYLRKLPAQTDNEIWDEIVDRFGELDELLRSVRLETREQAVHQRHGMSTVDNATYWEDPDVSCAVRPWLQIPYNPERDLTRFLDIWSTAQAIAKTLEPKLAERRLSVELLREWGSFCGYASVIENEYLQARPNLQHLKGSAAQSRNQQKVWFAHLYRSLKRKGDRRADVEGRIIQRILDIIDRKDFRNEVFPEDWFRQFLGEGGEDLASSFRQNKLPEKEILLLAEKPMSNLPPLDQ